MAQNNTDGNFKALYFSPHFWWTSIERGVYLTDVFGKEVIPGFEFRKWLREEKLEHDSLILHQEDVNIEFSNPEYGRALKNDYFFEVGAISKYGHKVRAQTIEDLYKKNHVNEDAPTFYTFAVNDLNHFVSMFFQNWLLFDTHYDWVRWQLYYDFVLSKLETPKKELYQYMWSVIFNEVEFHHTLFKDVTQYKKFRNKLEEITKESNYIGEKIKEIRQLNTVQ